MKVSRRVGRTTGLRKRRELIIAFRTNLSCIAACCLLLSACATLQYPEPDETVEDVATIRGSAHGRCTFSVLAVDGIELGAYLNRPLRILPGRHTVRVSVSEPIDLYADGTTRGRNLRGETTVSFLAEGHHNYVVRGDPRQRDVSVWIEDARSRANFGRRVIRIQMRQFGE